MRFRLTLAVLLWGTALSATSHPDSLFQAANAFYAEGNYDAAIALYDSLLQQGWEAPELHYNLGNAWFRKQRLGPAILHYERGLLLAPGDADLRHNLAVARSHCQDDFGTLSEFFLHRIWRSLLEALRADTWALIGLGLFWLGAAGLVLWLLGPSRIWRKRGFLAGSALLLLSVLPFSLAASRAALERHSGAGIILVESVPLRSSPDEISQTVVLLHEGTRVRLLSELGEWRKVRLSDGREGWLPQGTFEEI